MRPFLRLCDLFFQNDTSSRIYVMGLAACKTGHWLINVVILRSIFG